MSAMRGLDNVGSPMHYIKLLQGAQETAIKEMAASEGMAVAPPGLWPNIRVRKPSALYFGDS
jgi:hypothetical protein